jgi:hypothetical protein
LGRLVNRWENADPELREHSRHTTAAELTLEILARAIVLGA